MVAVRHATGDKDGSNGSEHPGPGHDRGLVYELRAAYGAEIELLGCHREMLDRCTDRLLKPDVYVNLVRAGQEPDQPAVVDLLEHARRLDAESAGDFERAIAVVTARHQQGVSP